MTIKASATAKWPLASRLFHWISALLLIVTWGLFVLYENTDNTLFIDLHKAFGLSLLCWMIARIFNRFLTKAPPSLPVSKAQDTLAKIVHFCLYSLILAMPIAGFLMTIYGGRSVNMFGLFEIAPFLPQDRSLARFFNNLHTGIIWTLILIFTGVHIVAALYHQFVKKDKLINRML